MVDDCTEFLEYIERATQDADFTDAGRIKALKSHLLGPAISYFCDFVPAGDEPTWAEAKAYLLKMYPSSDDYPSVMALINSCSRKPGEHYPEFAIRLSKLYRRLKKVAGPELTDNWVDTSRKELLIKACPPAIRNFINIKDDSFDKILKEVVVYLERNSQHRLTRADIDAEREKQIKAITATLKGPIPKQSQGKKSGPAKGQEQNQTAEVVAVIKDSKAPDKFKKFQGKSEGKGGATGNAAAKTYQKWDSKPRDKNKYKGLKCYVCGKIGHISSICYFNKDNKRRPPTKTAPPKQHVESKPKNETTEEENITCYRCGFPNHRSTHCTISKNF